MKHLLIIFTFVFLITNQLYATIVGKGLICNKREGDKVNVFFKDENELEWFDFQGYKISSSNYPYRTDLNKISFGRFEIDRKTLVLYLDYYQNGECKVYYSKQEIINEMQKELENAKSQNKL